MHDVYMLVALCWPQYQKWLLEWSSHGSSFGLNPRSWSGDAYDHKHILAFLYFSTLLCSVIAKKKKKGDDSPRVDTEAYFPKEGNVA